MAWKPVSQVFHGGTEDARKLTGRRIRVVAEFTMDDTGGLPFTLKPGMEGFVGEVPEEAKDLIGLAVAADGKRPQSMSGVFLTRSRIVRCNFPTFRQRFSIEV